MSPRGSKSQISHQAGSYAGPKRWHVVLAGFGLVVALFLAYANSWTGPFVYDDIPALEENTTIRNLADLRQVLSPPRGGFTVSGRPVLNLSFALNYAAGGLDVRGYHYTNFAIHALATLLLFGLVRRTLQLPVWREKYGTAALPLAFVTAALWGLHPLQTESVTYLVQRAESLMGLFYLATLYGFVRSVSSPAPWRWQCFSVGACLLGMATKENMVSAPVLVLCLDGILVADGFAAAWRRRRGYYAALAACWLLLAALVFDNGGGARGGTAGLGTGLPLFAYHLTQGPAIVRYLTLSVWPSPLIFERGPLWVDNPWVALPQVAVVLALVGATLFAVWRRSALGLAGLLFFAVLAPTSLVPGGLQMIAEHRMYLSLAAVLLPIVCLAWRWGGRAALAALLAAGVALGAVTHRRNYDYRSELALWQDTVEKSPNTVAEDNYGGVLQRLGGHAESLPHYERSLRLQPDNVHALTLYAHALLMLGRTEQARGYLQRALQVQPDYAEAHLRLGMLADALGRPAEALGAYTRTVQLRPNKAEAHYGRGSALAALGRFEEARAAFAEAVRLLPNSVEAHTNLGTALLMLGRPAEAVPCYETALRLRPDHPSAHNNLGLALAQMGRVAEAAAHFATAVQLAPDYAEARANLARAQAQLGAR